MLRESCCMAPYLAARRARRRRAADRRHPARHVHLRPTAVLGDVLRRARACAPSSRRRATRRCARPASSSPSPSRASRSAWRTGTSTGSLREGVDYVFVPNQINEETEFPQFNSHACPWGQTLPFVVRAAPRIEEQRDKHPRAAGALPPRARRARARPARDRRAASAPTSGALRAALDAADARPARVPRRPARRRRPRPRHPRGDRRARHRPHRPSVQHVRQGHQHGHPAQAAQVLRRQRDPARLPADRGHRHQRHRAQHVLELRAQDPPGGALRRRPPAPAPHLHDQLQVRPGLVHQALRARGLGQAVPHPPVRRASERRRGDDALRGLPRQQGLPALVVAARTSRDASPSPTEEVSLGRT